MPAESRLGVGQPDAGKMGGSLPQSPIESVDVYRATLERAGLSPDDVNRKANAFAATHPIVTEQTIGTSVRLSRRANACVEAARDAGIPEAEISRFVEHAMEAAATEHRSKAGLFGTSARFIGELRDRAGAARANSTYQGVAVTNKVRF